jgi:hypothetical protein
MIAPMLAGVVYFSMLSDFAQLLHDCNVKRVYFHSFWAKVKTGTPPDTCELIDLHCLAGLTSFANAFKMVVNGSGVSDADDAKLTANRDLIGKAFRRAWQPGKGERIRLIIGQVIDDRPPQSAWVPIGDFLAGTKPTEFPIVDYSLVED